LSGAEKRKRKSDEQEREQERERERERKGNSGERERERERAGVADLSVASQRNFDKPGTVVTKAAPAAEKSYTEDRQVHLSLLYESVS
jgi:hypothetical protein